MKVLDVDGDEWRVRVRLIPALAPLPRFRDRAKKVSTLARPYGVSEAHYRLAIAPSVYANLWFLWPLVLLAQVLVNLGVAAGYLARRIGGGAPWYVIASRRGWERSRTLQWAVRGLRAANDCADDVAEALQRGKGLYEIEGATLLDPPLFRRGKGD